MKQILVANKIPDKLILNEALFWVSFNTYFISIFNNYKIYSNKDFTYEEYSLECRQDDKINDQYELYSPIDFNSLFTKDFCLKHGFPTEWLEKESGDKEQKNIKKKDFQNALDDYLEIPKCRLFESLKSGKVKSYGRELIKEIGFETSGLYLEGVWNYWKEKPKHIEIPKEDLKLNSINWKKSYITNKNSFYCHILVDTKSLFEVFPEPEASFLKVYSVNGTLLIDENIGEVANPSMRGRKAEFDWRDFTREMTFRIKNNSLPKKQESCIYDMQIWCIKKWGKSPSVTNLKEHIRPFYEGLKKTENE